MTTTNTQPIPTMPQLVKASAIALAAAGVILVTAVLPAEYGIDPTGIGKAMGLTALSVPTDEPAPATEPTAPSAANTAADSPVAPVSAPAVSKSDVPYRSDEMSLTLQPDEGAEIKALMREGKQFVFTWAAEGGKVNFDMHGEKPNAGDEFSSYWKGVREEGGQGTFIAPFDGTHGWYWRNRGKTPVTVKVKVSGFHENFYKP